VPGIFLSYRSDDRDYATLLHAWLAERFGPAQVFWDHEDIDPGQDYRKVLSEYLASSQALVALIGPGWSPSEWIQREIGTALRREITILPVLVGGLQALNADDLPKSIRQLAFRQALRTSDDRFHDRFMQALGAIPALAQAPPGQDLRARRLAAVLLEQSDRRQRQALDALVAGDVGAAREPLDDAFELLMALRDFSPGDTELDLRLGFLYKDLSQASLSTDRGRALRYADMCLQLFQGLVPRIATFEPRNQANAWNGLGNAYLIRGEYERAIESCGRAVEIMPAYAAAWSDLFWAYDGWAQQGHVDLGGLRRAAEGLQASGDAELVAQAWPDIEAALRRWEGAGGRGP
jgi:tetratricopeptide (TPR) repeat protein